MVYFYKAKTIADNNNPYIKYETEMCEDIEESRTNFNYIESRNEILNSAHLTYSYNSVKAFADSLSADAIVSENNRVERVNVLFENLNSISKTDESLDKLKNDIDILYSNYKDRYNYTITNGGWLTNSSYRNLNNSIIEVNRDLS